MYHRSKLTIDTSGSSTRDVIPTAGCDKEAAASTDGGLTSLLIDEIPGYLTPPPTPVTPGLPLTITAILEDDFKPNIQDVHQGDAQHEDRVADLGTTGWDGDAATALGLAAVVSSSTNDASAINLDNPASTDIPPLAVSTAASASPAVTQVTSRPLARGHRRGHLTATVKQELERAYRFSPYPSPAIRQKLSSITKMTDNSIQKWFSRRRQTSTQQRNQILLDNLPIVLSPSERNAIY
ncbi:unnamed protein product, partial [Owenia fusiformis]